MGIINFLGLALAFFVLVLLGVWCWIQWKYQRLIQAASKVHCVLPTLPIIGNLHYLLFGLDKFNDMMIKEFLNTQQRGITTSCLWLGPYPLVFVSGEQDIQSILTNPKALEKGSEMEYFDFILKDGLLTAPANIWKTTRRAIEPLFHPRNLYYLMPKFNSISRELVTTLTEHESQGPVDVFPHILKHSLKSVHNLLFGLELDISEEEINKILRVFKRIPTLVTMKVFFFWLRNDVIFRFLYRKDLKLSDDCWDTTGKTSLKVSRENIAAKEKQRCTLPESEERDRRTEGSENLISVYSKLQKNYPEFTDNDLRAEIATISSTGSDSVSTAVSTCLLLLAYYQDIQERLFDEILSVVGLDRDVTVDDIKGMAYLDQVIKEMLRWAYIAPVITRKVSEDIKLSNYTVLSGTNIILLIYGPLMDQNIFPNPKMFDPERFSPENSNEISKFAYLPFSGGPRNCIGKNYANLLVKTMVVHVLRRFKLSTKMDIFNMKKTFTVFVMSAEGYKINFERRTLWSKNK